MISLGRRCERAVSTYLLAAILAFTASLVFLGFADSARADVTTQCKTVDSGDTTSTAIGLPFTDAGITYNCLDNSGTIDATVTLDDGLSADIYGNTYSSVLSNDTDEDGAHIKSIIVHSVDLDTDDDGIGDGAVLYSGGGDVYAASIDSISVDGTVVAKAFLEGYGGESEDTEYVLNHIGSITVETTGKLRLSSEFLYNNSGSVVDSVVNHGSIRSDGGNVIYNQYAGATIGSIENYGTMISETEVYNVIYNGEGGIITSIKNYGVMGPCDYSDPSDLPVYGDKCPSADISPRFAAIGNIGTIGTLSNASYLTYEGLLPDNYNIIITDEGYGKFEVIDADPYTPYPNTTPIGDFVFGVEDGSKITQLVYSDVLTNIDSANLANLTGSEVTGEFDGATWHLVESQTPGVWDLVFDSLPLYNPTAEETVAISLAARSAGFAQQFDNSRLVMHIANGRDRGRSVMATADVVYESGQKGDTSTVSTTIGSSTIFGVMSGAWADFDASGDNAAFDATAWGGTFGAEHVFDGIGATLGVFGSFSQVSSDGTDSSDDVESYGVGLIGSTELGGGVWLDAYGAYYASRHDIERRNGADSYSADAHGRSWSAYARLSYVGLGAAGASLTPYVALNYVDQWTDSYEEKGSGGGALQVASDETWNVLSFLGASLEAEVPLSATAMLQPKLDVSWVHLMWDGERSVLASYVGATEGTDQTISGDDQDYARIEASLGVKLDGGLALNVDYATEVGNDDVDWLHEVRLEASYEF